jgi:hypothetical protein
MTAMLHSCNIQYAPLCLLLVTHLTFSQPHLLLNTSTLELGTVYQGDTKAVTIPIRNTGTSTLVIRDVSTSCGCTSVKPIHKKVAPTRMTPLEVEINSNGLQGDLKKQIVILSNDPVSPSTIIVLKLTVKTDLEPLDKQYNLWLGNVTIGQTEKRRISYRNTSSQPFDISGAATSSPEVTLVTSTGTLHPNQVGTADLAVTPSHEGYAQSDLHINFSSKNQRSMTMVLTYIGIRGQ